MEYVVVYGILIFGCAMIIWGVALLLGKLRWVYVGQSIPVYAQREVLHLSIPIGVGLISIVLPIIYPNTKDWADPLLLFSFFATVILAIWQPWWLKPAWLRWLEDNYGDILEEMFAEARAIGRFNWAKQVRTQSDLEAWADSVAKKHGWQRLR